MPLQNRISAVFGAGPGGCCGARFQSVDLFGNLFSAGAQRFRVVRIALAPRLAGRSRRNRPLIAERIEACPVSLAGGVLERLHGRMKELVHQPARERLHGGQLFGGKRAQPAVNALDLGYANLLGLALQRHNGRRRIDCALAQMEALDFRGDECLRVNGLAAALFHVRRGNLLQVVDVVDEDAVELVHLRVHIAGHGNIDEKHGAVAPLVKKCVPMLGAEDGMRRTRGADDDVGAAGGLVKLVEFDYFRRHTAFERVGQASRSIGGSVAHKDRAGSLLDEVPSGQFAHLARAHQENGAALERSEDFARQVDGHRGDGNGIRSDAGLGADFLGGSKGALQKVLQLPGHRARSTRDGEGLFYLPQNLRLANHHGIEAGGHAEQVVHRFFVAIFVEVRAEDRGLDSEIVRQERAQPEPRGHQRRPASQHGCRWTR